MPVAALGCLIALAGVLLSFGTKSSPKLSLIAFLPALASALINAAAPGNFARHAVITPEYNILRSLAKSAATVFVRMQFLLEHTPAPYLFLLLLIASLGWTFSERMKRACTAPMLLCLLICFPALVVIPFPVILGYDGDMALRGYVVVNSAIALWLATLAVYLGCWIQHRTALCFRREDRVSVVAVCLCVFLACGGITDLRDSQQTVILSQMASGQYAAFFEERKEILRQIESAPEADVVVVQRVATPSYICDLGLNENPDNHCNSALARYFGKDSVIANWDLK